MLFALKSVVLIKCNNIYYTGVEKKNDDIKKAFYKTNMWDSCSDILKRDTRMRRNATYERCRRGYNKKNLGYWNTVKQERAREREKENRPPSKRFNFDVRRVSTMKLLQLRTTFRVVFGNAPSAKLTRSDLRKMILGAV